MSLYYFYYDNKIIVTSEENIIYSFIPINKDSIVVSLKGESLLEFMNFNRINEVVLIGGVEKLPPKPYFIQTYKGTCLRISSDFKYGVIGNQCIPVVRYCGEKETYYGFESRALMMIDRPINYHLDAFYIFSLLRPFYQIDIWDGSNTNKQFLLNEPYDLAIHFGHCNKDHFIFGKTKIRTLPQANIFVSHGCNSIQLFLRDNQPINAFCGFSYYCDGQTPSRGSNKLILEMLRNLLEKDTLLSQALLAAKKQYIQKNIGKDLNKTLLTASSEQELIDLITVISCNTVSDSQLRFLKHNKMQIQYSYGREHDIPPYTNTILLIIASEHRGTNITLFDTFGQCCIINQYQMKRYGELGMCPEIIYSSYHNEHYVLLNKKYVRIRTDYVSKIQYIY